MTPEQRAEKIIGRWRPYMKVFGPVKGFPKNTGSMQEDIATEIQAAVDEATEITEARVHEFVQRQVARACEDAVKISEEIAARRAKAKELNSEK